MEFEHILFPTDFSEHSLGLNSQVEWLASRFGSSVTILHVFEIPASWYGASDAPLFSPECFEALVESERQRLQDYTLNLPENQVRRVIAQGSPAWHITKYVKDQNIDVVMMGTRGLGKFRGLLMGSVAAQVIHDVDCPVWTDALLHEATDRKPHDFENLVCALDVNEEAIAVLRFAAAIAGKFNAKVDVVHTLPGAEARRNKYFDFDVHSYLMDSARVAVSKLQREAGTEFPVSVQASAVPKAVSEFALQKNAGLIVIGRGTLREHLGRLRTHAYQIIRDAPCPVLSCLPSANVRGRSTDAE